MRIDARPSNALRLVQDFLARELPGSLGEATTISDRELGWRDSRVPPVCPNAPRRAAEITRPRCAKEGRFLLGAPSQHRTYVPSSAGSARAQGCNDQVTRPYAGTLPMVREGSIPMNPNVGSWARHHSQDRPFGVVAVSALEVV